MLLRLTLPAVVLLYATGCCCCGGGGSSSSGGWQERLEEKAAEVVTEKLIEAATDIDDLNIDPKTGEISMTTEEGTVVIHTEEDGEAGTVDIQTADGQAMHLSAGKGEVPEGFPLSIPTDSAISLASVSADENNQTFMVMMEHSSMSRDQLAAHWETQLATLGEVKRTEMTSEESKIITLTVPSMGDTAVAIADADGTLISTVALKIPIAK